MMISKKRAKAKYRVGFTWNWFWYILSREGTILFSGTKTEVEDRLDWLENNDPEFSN